MTQIEEETELRRAITLPFITLYGVGTILGAGIYVLVGKVALFSGMHAPLAFIIAAFIAMFTGLSYAELSARFPVSAGEVAYVLKGFQRKHLSSIVGYLVILTGVISASTIIKGFVGYFQVLSDLPDLAIILGVTFLLWACASYGVVLSVGIATLITILEIGGLFYILSLVGDNLEKLPENIGNIFVPTSFDDAYGIIVGAFLAFYAFIGFEDMVNMAEEIKNPRKVLPTSIILAVIISTILYALVATVAVLVVPLDELASSKAPLADLAATRGIFHSQGMAVIGMVTIINGALVQIIMASRVLYGMGKQGVGLKIMNRVNPWTKTPIVATTVVTLVIFILAAWFPLVSLAKLTTFIILLVFIMVNGALIALKRRDEVKPETMHVPVIIPIISVYLCLTLLLAQVYQWAFLEIPKI